jgi:uncharacterized protein with HEPN domain
LSRRDERRIADIIYCCEKILRYTRGLNQEQLAEQELVQDAVLRNIEIIGEAAKNLSDDVKGRIPHIEWKKIASMRNWLSHVYVRVDPEIVWDVVENKIPELLRALHVFKDAVQP